MKISIRRPAISFALVSSIYWIGVTGLWSTITLLDYPYWLVVLISTLPPLLYAVAALWFCQWLARRIVKRASEKAEPDVQ